MKVLFDSSVMALALLENIAMHKTGVFRYAENLARELNKIEDVDLTFYSMLGKRDQYLWEQKLNDFLPLKDIPLLNHYHPIKAKMDNLKQELIDAPFVKRFFLKSLCESLRIIMNSSPNLVGSVEDTDIYYSPYHPLPKSIKDKKDIACFITIHDLIPLKYPKFFKVDKRGFFDQIFKKAKPNHYFIAASESTKADICHYYSIQPEKITVAYGAAQEEHFYPVKDSEKLQVVKEKYALNKPYILSVCTAEPRKNISLLVDAYIRILKENPSYEHDLVLCGAKGWGMESLIQKIKPYKDRIHITGFVKDSELASIYSLATVFVYPSLYEGFGIPIVEAMRCNTPVISSDRASLPEVLGDAGLYVDPSNLEDIAHQILKVTQDKELQKQLKEKGAVQAEKFSWANTSNVITDAFKTSLSQVR